MDLFHQLFNLATFSGAFSWVILHGYWVIFFAMLFEGPVVTSAASFAAALGYFDLLTIFIISLLSGILADVVYYAIGYWGRTKIVERFGHKVGLTKERILNIENLLKEHTVKTLIALKLTPLIPTPGLMLVGATRMPLKKFTTICLLIAIPQTIFFVVIGYYFGLAYDTFSRYFEYGSWILVIAIAGFIIISIWFKRTTEKFGKKIQKL